MSEQKIAKLIGAKLVKNSGRGMYKGDMLWKDFVVDTKEGKSFTLNEETWAKICSDARSHGISMEPMLLRVLDNGAMIACIPFTFLRWIMEERESCECH